MPDRPRLVTPAFILVTLSTLAYFLSVGALIPVLPRYIEGPLSGGSVAVGWGIGAFSLSAILLRPLAGRLGDRRGRRLIMVVGAAILTAAVGGYAAASSLGALIVLRLVAGAGEALFFTGAATAVADLAPEERRGEAVSLFSLALYAGLAAGPLVGEAVLAVSNFTTVWVVAAALSGIAVVVGLAVPDTRPEGAPSSGRVIHRAALVPGAVVAASIWGFAGFASFVPLYALSIGMDGSATVFLAYSLIILGIRGFGAWIPDRVGPARTASLSLIVSIGGLCVMAGWRDPAGLFAGTALFAVGQGLAFPALMTLAIQGAPPSERGAVVGTFTAFVDVAFGAGPVSLGPVAASFGYRGTFLASALVALFGLVLLRARFGAGRAADRAAGEAPMSGG